MKIPREHHKYVLGKGGQKLKDLERETTTHILIPRSEDTSDGIKISGTKENIDKARHFIQNISDEQVCSHMVVLVSFPCAGTSLTI